MQWDNVSSQRELTAVERNEEVEHAPGQDDDVVDIQPGRVDDGRVTDTYNKVRQSSAFRIINSTFDQAHFRTNRNETALVSGSRTWRS